MIYLFDATAISDLLAERFDFLNRVDQLLLSGNKVGICHPIYYELMRGLIWRKAPKKLFILQNKVLPKLDWIPLEDQDWSQAAQFWADLVRAGRSLSDVDILLAAMAYRLNATIVSSDNDFDALPIKRENWRLS